MLKNIEEDDVPIISYEPTHKQLPSLSILISNQRKRLNISARKFAKRIGLGENVVYAIERSTNFPTMPVLIKIAGAIDLDSDTLFQICRKEKIKNYVEKNAKLFIEYSKDPNIKINNILFSNDHISNKLPESVISKDKSSKRGARASLFGDITTPQTGKMIKEQRLIKGRLQKYIDKKLGKTYKYMSMLEAGGLVPSIKNIFEIAHLLNMNALSLFNSFVSEKLEKYDKAYCNEYHFYKTGEILPAFHKRKSHEDRKYKILHRKYKTVTSDTVVFLRKKMDISRTDLTKLMHTPPMEVERIENGICLLSFDRIMKYSAFFNVDKEKLFEMTLKDRIKIYEEKHKIGLKNFVSGENDECTTTIFFFRERNGVFNSLFNDFSHCFLKAGNYLRQNRKKHNFSMYHMAKKIGVEITQYKYWENGMRAIPIFAIAACQELFGDKSEDILDMVLKEKIDFYTHLYRKKWEEYKNIKPIVEKKKQRKRKSKIVLQSENI